MLGVTNRFPSAPNRQLVDAWRHAGVPSGHPSYPFMTEIEEPYIGRKAAAEKYRRGERTLERDISQALKLRDEEFLDDIRLRTKEGDLLPGNDVTFEKIDELKNSGQVPTWEIAESFLAQRYGLRSEEPQEDNPSQQPEEGTGQASTASEAQESKGDTQPSKIETSAGLPPLPRDPVEQADLLKALYQDLLHRFQVEHDRNEKIFALIETIPKQQEQTNVLLREFQELMKSGKPSLTLPAKQVTPNQPRPQVVEAQTTATDNVIDVKISEPAKPSPSPRKNTPKKKAKKRSTKPTMKKMPKAAQKRPTFAERHLPSLSRMFGSTPSKRK